MAKKKKAAKAKAADAAEVSAAHVEAKEAESSVAAYEVSMPDDYKGPASRSLHSLSTGSSALLDRASSPSAKMRLSRRDVSDFEDLGLTVAEIDEAELADTSNPIAAAAPGEAADSTSSSAEPAAPSDPSTSPAKE